MNLVIIIFIILFAMVFYTASTERLGTPALVTNVYTMTPQKRSSTPSEIAQLWWQPIAYIFTPYISMPVFY